jgi:hypothetical protein
MTAAQLIADERNKRAQPDPEFIRKDDYGRPLYTFLLNYEMDGGSWQTEIWAYDFADAEKRCAAMRESLAVMGQAFGCIPA